MQNVDTLRNPNIKKKKKKANPLRDVNNDNIGNVGNSANIAPPQKISIVHT